MLKDWGAKIFEKIRILVGFFFLEYFNLWYKYDQDIEKHFSETRILSKKKKKKKKKGPTIDSTSSFSLCYNFKKFLNGKKYLYTFFLLQKLPITFSKK